MDMQNTAHTDDAHRGYRGRHRRAGFAAALVTLVTGPLTLLGRHKSQLPTAA